MDKIEKIRQEIERLKKCSQSAKMEWIDEGYNQNAFAEDCRIKSFDKLISYIDSLQQEQPEGLHFTPLNRLIQKIPSKNWNDTVNNYAKKLRDCLIKEGYRKDAEVLQGYISYMNGNNVPMATMDEHEQPEVDLDKEIRDYTETLYHETFGNGQGTLDEFDWEDIVQVIDDTARYFYNLNKNDA